MFLTGFFLVSIFLSLTSQLMKFQNINGKI